MLIEAGLLGDVPRNRSADLLKRKNAGTLTSAERLALCVLAGGTLGEETIDKLIDAALEEYGTGGYRVPVRVVGDPTKLRLIVNTPEGTSQSEVDAVCRRFSDLLRQPGPTVFMVNCDTTVQAFEVEESGD